MESDKQILEFFNKLSGATKQQSKNFEVTNGLSNQLLAIEVKQAKFDKKEKTDEARHKKRMLQLQKRKEKEQKGPIQVLFGGKEKEEGKGLNAWLMGALGLGALAGGGAWLMSDDPQAKKIREQITETTKDLVKALKEELEKAITQGFKDIEALIRRKTKSQIEGTGLGDETVEGQQSLQIREAEGSYQEKMDKLEAQAKGGGGFLGFITGEQEEAKQGLYRLQAGEEWQNNFDFRPGGGATSRGAMGIVTGDISYVRKYTTGITKEDEEYLKKLEELTRDRREANDDLAKLEEGDDGYEQARKRLNDTTNTISRLLTENDRLRGFMEQQARNRISAYDNPKQTGGAINMKGGQPFTVPGSGIGDSFYQPLPANSFVLNKRASRQFNIDAQKRQAGGYIGKAVHHIQKDEAISSLTPGVNDYIKPGGNSVRSGKPWSSITPNTQIHAYPDKYKIPTIGWGTTYYDSLANGTDKVKMGDTITKKRADGLMTQGVREIDKKLSGYLKYYKKMSAAQKAGLLSFSYNAGPNAATGSWKNLTAALQKGDMKAAAKETHRSGLPGRSAREKAMLLNGPLDLSKLKGPKKAGQGNSGQRIVGTGNPLVDHVRGMLGGPKVGDVIKKQSGGPLIVPGRGEGDQIPMTLPEGSFVLNRSASRAMDRLQNGGIVGDHSDMERFAQATVGSDTPQLSPPVVIVKRRGRAMPQPASTKAPDLSVSGGVNICEMSDTLHRIQSGASI